MKLKYNIITILILINTSLCFAMTERMTPWTWSYSKYFCCDDFISSPESAGFSKLPAFTKVSMDMGEMNGSSSKPKICYVRSESMGYNPQYTFSQLIFSWNAERPQQGLFRFSLRVRCLETKRWSPWYSMMEWGAGVQQSFVTKNKDPYSEYLYVRLEMLKGALADNFQIKIEAVDGADLSLLRLINVCISDYSKFSHENVSQYSKLNSVYVEGVPMRSQKALDHPDNKVLCSPTSLSMMMSYLTQTLIDPIEVADGVYDNGLAAYGSWPFNTAYAYERSGGNILFKVIRLSSFYNLYTELKNGMPVVVSVRGELAGAPQPYPHGHLLVVVGYDAQSQQVICHDPAHQFDSEVMVRYNLADFLTAWERSYRLSYQAWFAE